MKTHLIFMIFVVVISVVYPQKKNQKAISPEMIKVEGGTFNMGSNENSDYAKPVHKVTLSDFLIGKYEVTQELWESVMGDNPSWFKGTKRPVEHVSWYDVIELCNKLSAKEGLTPAYKIDKTQKDPNNTSNHDNLKWLITCDFSSNGYRLPTEAEWEYAARGGNKSKGYTYSGSDDINEVAWYNDNSVDETHEVGKKKPNELGLYDMSGNVKEWCWDWYSNEYYSSSVQTNPGGSNSGSDRVWRGGSCYSAASICRVANRFSNGVPVGWDTDAGFRLAKTK
jgi:formylglycine-generating enzyme required for sulfatase activity